MDEPLWLVSPIQPLGDGRLRVSAGQRVFLIDMDAPEGTAHYTSYNHTVTVRPLWRDVLAVRPGLCLIAWGRPGDRRGVIVTAALADMLLPAVGSLAA